MENTNCSPCTALRFPCLSTSSVSSGILKKRRLIQEALDQARKLGYKTIIVIGHPAYYSKIGFKKYLLGHIKPPFDVPKDVFMALGLEPHTLD